MTQLIISSFQGYSVENLTSEPPLLQSLEEELVRGQVLRLVSLPLWHSLSRGRLQLELHDQPQLARHWKHLAKKEAKAAKEVRGL